MGENYSLIDHPKNEIVGCLSCINVCILQLRKFGNLFDTLVNANGLIINMNEVTQRRQRSVERKNKLLSSALFCEGVIR